MSSGTCQSGSDTTSTGTPGASTACSASVNADKSLNDADFVVSWDEFCSLRASVGQLADCVEELQSNMGTMLSMLVRVNARGQQPSIDEETQAQCARLAQMFSHLKLKTGGEVTEEVAKDRHVLPVHALAAGQGIDPYRQGIELLDKAIAAGQGQWTQISDTSGVLCDSTNGRASSVPAETLTNALKSPPSVTTVSKDAPGPTRSPRKPAGGGVTQPGPRRCPASPLKSQRAAPTNGDKAEPMNRILPPPRETPRKDLAGKDVLGRSPLREPLDAIQQAAWGHSPQKDPFASRQLDSTNGTWSQSPEKVRSYVPMPVEAARSPLTPHRGSVEIHTPAKPCTPRSGSLAQWMQPRACSQPAVDSVALKVSL